MADVKTNTIIIRDETSGSKKTLTTKDVNIDGTIINKKRKNLSPIPSKPPAVEPNRKMRIVNSTLNKMSGGVWERGKRFVKSSIGATGGNPVGWTTLGQFAFNFGYAIYQNQKREAQEENEKNILRIRTGSTSLPTSYNISTNFFGKINYKTNR